MRHFALPLLLAFSLSFPGTAHAEIKVGAILSLSGPTADYGDSMRNSMDLALRDSGRTDITIIYEDAEYDSKKAVSAFQKLRSVDHVDLVYVWGVAFCKAIAPLAEVTKTPMIGQCIDHTSARGKEYVIRFMNTTDEYIQKTIQYLNAKQFKRIGIVMSDNGYNDELLAALQRHLDTVSIETIQRFSPSDTDFRTAISRLRSSDIDIVGVFLLGGQISTFYRQRNEVQWDIPTFGTNFFESLSEIKLARGRWKGPSLRTIRCAQHFEIDMKRSLEHQVRWGLEPLRTSLYALLRIRSTAHSIAQRFSIDLQPLGNVWVSLRVLTDM